MQGAKAEDIIIYGDNIFECLYLIMWSWIRNLKVAIIHSNISSNAISFLNKIFFIRRYIDRSIRVYKSDLGKHKGLYFEVNKETVDLTLKFYNHSIANKNIIVSYYNRMFKTEKFEAYIKKAISARIYALLDELYSVKFLAPETRSILITKNPINRFIVEYLEEKYKISFQAEWFTPLWESSFLFIYYGWLFAEFFSRGVVLNKKKKHYKLSKEVAWEFYRPTLRDDLLIDNERFKTKDMLLLDFYKKGYNGNQVFKEAQKRGFDIVSIKDLKINVNKNIFNLLYTHAAAPLKIYLYLLFKKQLYLFYYIFLFHRYSFPVEILMNLYDIDCYFSSKDGGGVGEKTIVLNKYSTKDAILHWSDLAVHPAYHFAFIAHNNYFVWGDMHYNLYNIQYDNYFVDRKINIGCIFKRQYSNALRDKSRIIARLAGRNDNKEIVTFFDNTINNSIHFTEQFFLEFLKIVKRFSEINKDINVLLKPKDRKSYDIFISKENYDEFKRTWDELQSCDNFIWLNPFEWSLEQAVAISDVCVSMGMSTPSTVALICNKNGLYYDTTDNVYHPFARKYKNSIVFEDENLLFKQIEDILEGRFSCRDVISEEEIRGYDAFDDDNALIRLYDDLHNLISTKN